MTLGAKRRYDWMVSIHKYRVKEYVTKEELDEVVLYLKFSLPSLHFDHYVYELGGKYNQLHFHGICSTDVNFRYKGYSNYMDFRIFWRQIINQTGLHNCLQYIEKRIRNEFEQQQLLDENYYNHNYGFI